MAYFQVRTVSFREGRDALFAARDSEMRFQHPIDASMGFSSAGFAKMCFAAKAWGGKIPLSCVGLEMEKKSRTEKKIAMLKVETCEMYPKHSD